MLAEQILSINVGTRRLCKNCNGGAIISQKMRVLYLIRNEVRSPKDLIGDLCIAKPNLTILSRNMAKEGLLEKVHLNNDMRAVYYKITEKGKAELARMIDELNSSIIKELGLSEKEVQKCEKKLESTIEFLNSAQ